MSPLSLIVVTALLQAVSSGPIVLDARFEDWADVKPALVDPVDAPDAFVDLGEVRVASDSNFIHLLVDFGRTVNVQGLDGTADIILNADGDEATGVETQGVKGADLIIRCTPPNPDRPGSPGRGIGITSTTYVSNKNDITKPALNPYDIGLSFAPTHAGRRIEFRIARSDASAVVPASALPPLFTGGSFTGRIVFTALDGTTADETDLFACALQPRTAGSTTQAEDAGQPIDPLTRAEGATLRVMSWNAELGAIISRPEPFVRTINAITPDVILLQELTDKISEDQMREFLAHLDPDKTDRPWHIVMGKGGGDLRCAVLSRLPLDPAAPLELVTYADRPERSVRVAAALITFIDRPLLVVSTHLKCCGRNGSPEDVTRLSEVELIRKSLAVAMEQTKAAGVLVAGDYNLVGSREPLENMQSGLDVDGSNAEVIDAYQLDGRSNATWFDRGQPFAPGRLDYAVFSDSTLRPVKCFVYDSHDLAPRWRDLNRTQADDTNLASDHLPVVFDLTWVK